MPFRQTRHDSRAHAPLLLRHRRRPPPIRDDEGLEFANAQAARDEASRAMADLAKDYLPGGEPQKNITMWVRNERGEPVLQLALSFALTELTAG